MQTNYELRKKILQRLKLFVTRLEVLKLKNKPFHHHLTTTFVNQKRKLYKKKYINIFLTKQHRNNYFSGILRYYRASNVDAKVCKYKRIGSAFIKIL